MRRALFSLILLCGPLVCSATAAAEPCSGDPTQIQPITLTVDGQPATGLFTLPAGPPRGLVVFGHGAGNTSDSWKHHLTAVSQREGVIAVAMDYRGMQITGRDEKRGVVAARGWPAKAGSEDLVAAGQHFDRECPGLAGIVLYGVSMGGNMSGLALAARAQRSDGRALFDYWIAVEGVHNVTETYHQARLAGAANAFAARTREDIEVEMGGPFETRASTYAERTNVNRVGDMAASGVRGVILVHALEDGTVPYNQSRDMTDRLRGAGVPTDFYTVGGRGSDEPDTNLTDYAGIPSENAGHGWEGSTTHVVIQTGFDRLNALLTRGEPAPCNREFRVEDSPANVTPDPRQAPPACKPDPLPPAGSAGACRDVLAPARPVVRVTGPRSRPTLRGRATDRGCGRIARVMVAVGRRDRYGRCHFLTRNGKFARPLPCRRRTYLRARGRESWRLEIERRLPRGRYRAIVVARDAAGHRGPARTVHFRVR